MRLGRSIFFLHLGDAGKSRPAFQERAKLRMLLRSADRKHLNAAVQEISHVAADVQLFRGMLREITEADSLYDSRYEVPLRLCRVAHKDKKL